MDRHGYIETGRDTVPGWFHRTDALLFEAIDRTQERAGITGDLLEIGCYQGASAILLGYLRRPGEAFVVCDLFDGVPINTESEMEHDRWYRDLTRRRFEDNYRRFHDELPQIVAGPSSTLGELGLGRTFRFIHVDGSHAYDLVRSDLLMTRELLVPGGVVVFDDIVTLHTPGVIAAVWEGVARDGLVPLIQSRKLYATWGRPFDIDVPAFLPSYPHEVMGHRLLHVEDEPSGASPPPASTPAVDAGGTDGSPSWAELSERERRLVQAKRQVMTALRRVAAGRATRS